MLYEYYEESIDVLYRMLNYYECCMSYACYMCVTKNLLLCYTEC
jgi:hypothetical protein